MSRISRDMARAHEGHTAPREGAEQEWRILPETYLTESQEASGDETAQILMSGKRPELVRAQRLWLRGRVVPGGSALRPDE